MKDNRPVIKMRALSRFEHPEDGRRLEKEAEFEVHSEQTALTLAEKRLAERLSPEAPTEEQEAAAAAADETAGPWLLSKTPQQYLDQYGNEAKHSAHAKAVLERGEGGQ